MVFRGGVSGGASPRQRVVVVGPVPPPMHGVAVATRSLLDSRTLSEEFELIHLDTSDRRSLNNLGRVDLTNVLLALTSCIRLASICVRRRPALIYYTLSQNAPALLRDVCLASIGQALGAGSVVQLAGARYVDTAKSGSFAGYLTRLALRRAARVLVLGESQAAGVVEVCGHNRVSVVPNGIAESDGIGSFIERQQGRRLNALFLGALSESKGIGDLIVALALVRSAGCDVTVTFGGEWSGADVARRVALLIAEHGLNGAVHFPGVLRGAAKQDALEEADVYVLPSLAEGQPISILEAMSVGLPVISTCVGAVPDTVEDGVTGILVAPGEPEMLAGSLCLLCHAPMMRTQLGQNGYARFLERFTLERSHQSMLEALRLALE